MGQITVSRRSASSDTTLQLPSSVVLHGLEANMMLGSVRSSSVHGYGVVERFLFVMVVFSLLFSVAVEE